jgi:hypothetical protein
MTNAGGGTWLDDDPFNLVPKPARAHARTHTHAHYTHTWLDDDPFNLVRCRRARPRDWRLM